MAEKPKPKGVKAEKTGKKTKAEKLPLVAVGKRKKALATARFHKGAGLIRVNKRPLDKAFDRMSMLKVTEVTELAGDAAKGYDVDVTVKGGGYAGQAEACRIAIARGLAELGGESVRKVFLSYDRNLLVYDPRRTEPHKPSRSSKGARRHKQRSKR